QIVTRIANNTTTSLENKFNNITKELEKIYGGHVSNNEEWMLNCAGGFKTQMKLLHVSMTEYVIFWGSAIQTLGMSGRHFGEFNDFIISGELTQWNEGEHTITIFRASGRAFHGKMKASVVMLAPNTWIVEHFVGFLPFTIPFGKFSKNVLPIGFLKV